MHLALREALSHKIKAMRETSSANPAAPDASTGTPQKIGTVELPTAYHPNMITFTSSNLAYFPEATLAFSSLRSFLPRLLLCLLAVSSLTSRSIATEKTTLDGEWRFRIDAKAEGESQHWQNEIPPATELVRVPHTWNIGKYEDHEGLAWYFRTFKIPGLVAALVEAATTWA